MSRPRINSTPTSAEDLHEFYLEFIKHGKYTRVDEMLRDQGLPNKNDNRLLHLTVLYAKSNKLTEALKEGCKKIVELLVNAGLSINQPDEESFTPLHNACRKGYDEMVEILLGLKANPELKDREGNTALHLASTTKIVELLISSSSVDVNARNNRAQTKLHLVCGAPSDMAYNMMLKLLQTRKAGGVEKKVVKIDQIDKKGNAPVHLLAHFIRDKAARKNDSGVAANFKFASDMLTQMILAGASVDDKDAEHMSLKDYAEKSRDIAAILDNTQEKCRMCSACAIQ